MIRVSAYKWVPPVAQGLVRDLRVRWALEEAGLPYEIKLIAMGPEQAAEEYRAQQPFGQVPVYEEDGRVLFESGAIVLHIAEKSETLMPKALRDDVVQWLFAALNTVEIPVMFVVQLMFVGVTDGPVRDAALARCAKRLGQVAAAMKDREYIAGDRFTAADIMMITVMSQLRTTDLLTNDPVIAAYHARCTARPAYKKALADQLRVFRENAPAG